MLSYSVINPKIFVSGFLRQNSRLAGCFKLAISNGNIENESASKSIDGRDEKEDGHRGYFLQPTDLRLIFGGHPVGWAKNTDFLSLDVYLG